MDWHTRSGADVLAELGVSPSGLTGKEAEKRLKEQGANELSAAKKHGLLYRFLMQFKNVFVIILLAAAVISAAVAVFEKEPGELIDTAIILVIVVMNAVIGVVQESKAERALQALKSLSKPFARVRRDGATERIPAGDIVQGDLVLLEAGDSVPADLRLLEAASLKIDESQLTGESVPAEKNTGAAADAGASLGDRRGMAYSGSTVTYGRGEGVAVATGMHAEIGKIAAMLDEEAPVKTPMQKRIDRTGKVISIVIIVIAAIIFGVSMLSCIRTGFTLDKLVEAFMTGIAIAVAAIPEGLTAVITIIMALGVQNMSKRNAVIRRLPAVETLGSTEVICSDKTGTITMNRMEVQRTLTYAKDESELVRCMALCNDAEFSKGKAVGDPTETALLSYAKAQGFDFGEEKPRYARVAELPFDSERKLMSTVNLTEEGRTAYTKGAPDVLLARTSYISDGAYIRPITRRDRERISAVCQEMAKKALRVLAFAKSAATTDFREENLTFLGLAGMLDPPRKEVAGAVKICRQAGVRPVMITGDHADTAFAVAKEVGICENYSEVMTGSELSKLSDEEFARKIDQYSVYARVSPEHKVRIVKAWKSRGKIVAMTGDGVNDAPGIKAADIGVGMGISGTDVTKSAADMVLADDNFTTIVAAVEEGRKIYANIQKTIQFLLSANVAEVLSLFFATILFSGRGFVFLLPIQILWINLVTDSLPALALGLEPVEPDAMLRPPHRDAGHLLSGAMGVNIVYQGLVQTIIVLGVYVLCAFTPWGHEVGTTMAFVVLNVIQLFHCFNAKSLEHSIFRRGLFKNKFMLFSFAVGLLLTVSVVLIPPVAKVFCLAPLSAAQWLVALLASFLIIPIVELMKHTGKRCACRKKNRERRRTA